MSHYLNEEGFWRLLLSLNTKIQTEVLDCTSDAIAPVPFATMADLLASPTRQLGVEMYVVNEDQFYYWNGIKYVSRNIGEAFDLTELQQNIEEAAIIVG